MPHSLLAQYLMVFPVPSSILEEDFKQQRRCVPGVREPLVDVGAVILQCRYFAMRSNWEEPIVDLIGMFDSRSTCFRPQLDSLASIYS